MSETLLGETRCFSKLRNAPNYACNPSHSFDLSGRVNFG